MPANSITVAKAENKEFLVCLFIRVFTALLIIVFTRHDLNIAIEHYSRLAFLGGISWLGLLHRLEEQHPPGYRLAKGL
jgi:hypothetical protein